MDERTDSDPNLYAPWLTRAMGYLGQTEQVGGKLSAFVRRLFKWTRFPSHLVNLRTAWCAAFLCTVLEESGVQSPRSARARDFLRWGIGLAAPVPGAVLVFMRGNQLTGEQGHVALSLGFEEAGQVVAIGGNQQNAVTIERKKTTTLLGVRWPSDRPLPKAAVRV